MENVTGITSIGAGVVVAAIKDEFAKLGYRIESKILRAEEFGVPQERRRIFFIGTRIKAPIFFPVKLHDGLERPFTTIWDAIGDLPKIGNGEDPGIARYSHEPLGWYQRYVRGNSIEVNNGNYVLDCAGGNPYILCITLCKGICHDKERAGKIRARRH